jgi:large subunit ribosomal protein L23
MISASELERYRTILSRPVMTEKSMRGTERGKYTFRVPLDANKTEIRRAVETLFSVSVRAVNTMRVKGKSRRRSAVYRTGKTAEWKKAIVTLVEGQSIDLFEGS